MLLRSTRLIRHVVEYCTSEHVLLMMLFISNCNVKTLKHEAEFYGITPLGECVSVYMRVCACACVCVHSYVCVLVHK